MHIIYIVKLYLYKLNTKYFLIVSTVDFIYLKIGTALIYYRNCHFDIKFIYVEKSDLISKYRITGTRKYFYIKDRFAD